MSVLKKGDTGQAVRDLQKRLNQHNAALVIDGWYGEGTEKAVAKYQLSQDLVPTGKAGVRTQALLAGLPRGRYLSMTDVKAAAVELKVEPAILAAVAEVESIGFGFMSNGQPLILFERHIFYRILKNENPKLADDHYKSYPQLCNPNRGGYVGGLGEYNRFSNASFLHSQAAIEACSWGLFQIMGMHWEALGYINANSYRKEMEHSEGSQLLALVRFIQKNTTLHKALKGKKWDEFARIYNGPLYKENNYDIKLARAYSYFLDVLEVFENANTVTE